VDAAPSAHAAAAVTGPIDDEEALARSVERAVLPLARARRAGQPLPLNVEQGTAASGNDQFVPAPTAHTSRPSDDRWGGLPAPWEPLPTWLQADQPATPPPPPPTGNGNSGSGGVPPSGGVMRAAADRPAPEEVATAAQPPQAQAANRPTQQPAPDLDALALQVYDIVKRRIAAERQRAGIG
ncbi:MAG: hypothetical protein DCC58_13920, partial [Chloroflexi bacterium]